MDSTVHSRFVALFHLNVKHQMENENEHLCVCTCRPLWGEEGAVNQIKTSRRTFALVTGHETNAIV